MAGKPYIKTGTSTWAKVKRIYLKSGGQTWSPIRKAYIKTGTSAWRKFFDTTSNRPFIEGNDRPKIRLNTFRTNSTYNPTGTANDPVNPVVEAPPVQQMGPPTTTPTSGWPNETIGNHLWGYDGDWKSGNGSTINYTYQWLYNLSGDRNDNTFDPAFSPAYSSTTNASNTSSTGRADMLTNSSTYLGRSGGDYFDKNFLTFRVVATNSAGSVAEESVTQLYIVRQRPYGYVTMISPNTVEVGSTLAANITFEDFWYNKPDRSISYVEWFAVNSIGESLTGSNRIKIQYFNTLSFSGTSDARTTTTFYTASEGGAQGDKYYYVKITLNNSNTTSAVIPISGFIPSSPYTDFDNTTVLAEEAVAPPTFLTATTNRSDGVNLTFGGSADAVSYDIFWNTNASANPSDAATPDFPGESSPYLDTTIGIGVTRWYWVRAKNSSGQTSSWYPVGDGVTGTRIAAYNVSWNGNGGSSGNEGIPWSFTEGGSVTVPSATRIGYTFSRWTDTPSGDYTYTTTNIGGTFFPPAQNITMYARWTENVCTIPNVIGMTEIDASNAVNAAGFLYEFTDYQTTYDSSLNGRVAAIDPAVGTQPGCGTNITLTIYNYVNVLTAPSIYNVIAGAPNAAVSVYFTGGSGPYYQMWWTTGVGGTSYDASGGSSPLTDSSGPGSAGNWNMYVRSVSSPSNTGTGPSATISDWSPAWVFTVSNPVTCGSCEDYGSANYTGQTNGCAGAGGTYYTVYNNYYIFQRQTCSDGTYQECAIRSYNTVSSSTQINGLCGYTEPVACVCNYTDYGSYHYSPQCCPSGAQRSGSLSGSTSGACCPTVNKTLRYICTNYDVTNSASANYYDCYSVGQCAAQNNASGNRTTCYI